MTQWAGAALVVASVSSWLSVCAFVVLFLCSLCFCTPPPFLLSFLSKRNRALLPYTPLVADWLPSALEITQTRQASGLREQLGAAD